MITAGQKEDPRTPAQVRRQLQAAKACYQKLSAEQKRYFDPESLTNPYADSRILWGDRKQEIRRVLVGIDIDVAELLLADHLSRQGTQIDLVIAHHPAGRALAGLNEVMALQTDVLENLGVRTDIARDLMKKRSEEVDRRLHSGNHDRVVDAAALLGIPLLCCHTPADNHVTGYLQQQLDRRRPRRLIDVIDLLLREPEYQEGAAKKLGPEILVGEPQDKAGRVLVDMTGGTEGSKEIFARLSQLGIETQVIMHFSEGHYNRVKNEYMKVVNAGHMASDSLGMNLLFDKLERKTSIEILACSGFRRVRR